MDIVMFFCYFYPGSSFWKTEPFFTENTYSSTKYYLLSLMYEVLSIITSHTQQGHRMRCPTLVFSPPLSLSLNYSRYVSHTGGSVLGQPRTPSICLSDDVHDNTTDNQPPSGGKHVPQIRPHPEIQRKCGWRQEEVEDPIFYIRSVSLCTAAVVVR